MQFPTDRRVIDAVDSSSDVAGQTFDNRRLTFVYKPIGDIQSNPRDPRIYGRAEKRRIAKALKKFGAPPLIVNADLTMLSGNIWLEAAIIAGFSEVPVIVAGHLTADEAEALMLAQVRLVERGEWDEQKLGIILRDLTIQNLDFDVTITGFDPAEIDLKILALDAPRDEPDSADDPAPTGPSVTRPGDLWALGQHRLLCGDALNTESYKALLLGEVADIVFTDPPYNVPIAGHVSGLGAVGAVRQTLNFLRFGPVWDPKLERTHADGLVQTA